MLMAAAMILASLGLPAALANADDDATKKMTGTAVHDPKHVLSAAEQVLFAAREGEVHLNHIAHPSVWDEIIY